MIMGILWMITIAIAIIILFFAWKEKLNYEKFLKMEKESIDHIKDILLQEEELLNKIKNARDKISE